MVEKEELGWYYLFRNGFSGSRNLDLAMRATRIQLTNEYLPAFPRNPNVLDVVMPVDN